MEKQAPAKPIRKKTRDGINYYSSLDEALKAKADLAKAILKGVDLS